MSGARTVAEGWVPPARELAGEIEHGSDRGYRAHLRADDVACPSCVEAHREAMREWRERTGRARKLKPCGTRAAYKRHLAARELPCQPCLLANRHKCDLVTGEERQDEAAA